MSIVTIPIAAVGFVSLALGASISAIPPAAGAQTEVAASRIAHAELEPQNWFTTGRDFGEQHYSPLEEVNQESVSRLGFAWESDASAHRGPVEHRLEATPVVVDGVMYTSGAWGAVLALDAATGKQLWRFDPVVDASRARRGCCDPVNRGVAVWKDKVYVAQFDGWLVALDAASGKVDWKVDTITDRTFDYTITGAPRVAGSNVVIGNGGNEFGIRGYLTAYDLETGAQRWRFFTVPDDPKKGYEQPALEMAAKTWDTDTNWAAGGGGSPWDGMAYDPALNLLYVGTGNGFPHPVWLRSPKKTDNLFVASILAIKADTGRLAWYYQTTPGDSWDYDATQPLILADFIVRGQTRPALMQANRNGFFYVIDRRTGKLIAVKNYVKVTWAKYVDLATGRPIETTQGDYSKSAKLVAPTHSGGHSWHPMAFSPKTELVYFPQSDFAEIFRTHARWHYRPHAFDWGTGYDDPKQGQEADSGTHLLAWDPIGQRKAWESVADGGGALATAGGVVFQGTSDGHLRAYGASDGKVLKDLFVGTGIVAAPMTYAVNGAQYIAVMAGAGSYLHSATGDYSNRGRILVFRLDGKDTPLPEQVASEEVQPLPTRPQVTKEILEHGEKLFMRECARCHSGGLDPERSGFPNLFNLPPGIHDIFNKIVLQGLLADGGMASFADLFTEKDVDAIHEWLIDAAYRQRAGDVVTHMHFLQ